MSKMLALQMKTIVHSKMTILYDVAYFKGIFSSIFKSKLNMFLNHQIMELIQTMELLAIPKHI